MQNADERSHRRREQRKMKMGGDEVAPCRIETGVEEMLDSAQVDATIFSVGMIAMDENRENSQSGCQEHSLKMPAGLPNELLESIFLY